MLFAFLNISLIMLFYLYSGTVESYIWVVLIDDFEMTEESTFLFLIDRSKILLVATITWNNRKGCRGFLKRWRLGHIWFSRCIDKCDLIIAKLSPRENKTTTFIFRCFQQKIRSLVANNDRVPEQKFPKKAKWACGFYKTKESIWSSK